MQNHPEDPQPDRERPDGGQPVDGSEPAEERATDDFSFTGALGVDPEYPDPGCTHEWRHLLFLEDDEGIACSRCGRDWAVDDDDARDAVLTLWHSTRQAIEDLAVRQERITGILEALTGALHCHWCDRWSDDPTAFVTVDDRRACPAHLGQLLSQNTPARDADVDLVAAWLTDLLERGDGDIYPAWLVEKTLVEYPDLSRREGLVSGIGSRRIVLDPPWVRLLGTPKILDLNGAATAVARLLELPAPTSRAGRTLLVGTLALAVLARATRRTASAEELASFLSEAAPTSNRDRATIVLDLYRHEMQADGTVTGEMADDLVEALIGRAASELAPIVLSVTDTDEQSDPDPR